MRTLTILIALALVTIPTALAQEAERGRDTHVVTFYGHVFNSGLDVPMPSNTQFPDGEDNLGLGLTHACADAAGLACNDDPSNKLVLFSTAGLVDVKSRSEFTNDGGYERFHNERGSTKDIVLDTSKPITARVYMSLDAHVMFVGGGETYCWPVQTPRDIGCPYPYWGWDPGYWPSWTVEATLYYAVLGEHGEHADEAPDVRPSLADGSAVAIAHGKSTPTDVINGLPGYPNVHAFNVDLGTANVDTIPKEANFFLVFSWYGDAPTRFASFQWRLWTGEFFPSEFTLPVKNAFDVEYVVPQFVHGKLALLGVLNTPWGSYDVDSDSIKLTVKDARGQQVDPVRIETHLDGSVAHGAHYKPVNITYVWDYVNDKLPAGKYTAEIYAQNRQGSAASQCEATFEVLAGGMPGPVEPGRCGIASVDESTLPPPPPAGTGGNGARSSDALPAVDLAILESDATQVAPKVPVTALGLVGLALVAGARAARGILRRDAK